MAHKNIHTRYTTALIFLFLITFAQLGQTQTAEEALKKNIDFQLDLRYIGGSISFSNDFIEYAEYPDAARQNCIIGITIVSFEVDCNGELVNLRIKNPLNYGINEVIEGFFKETQGKWNTCEESKYNRFEIPIQFTIEGTQTNNSQAYIIEIGDSPGFKCKSDDYYYENALEYYEKKKYKKAIKMLDELIKRNPYRHDYIELKTKCITEE